MSPWAAFSTMLRRKCDEDTRVSKYQDFVSQAMSVYVAISSASAWFTPELLSLSEAQMAAFYAECPELELYRRNLDRVFRRRAHTLSPAEEALLASAGDMASQPDNIYSMFGDADLTFPDAVDAEGEKHPLTHGTFVPLLYSQDRVLRKSAFDAFYGVMRQFPQYLCRHSERPDQAAQVLCRCTEVSQHIGCRTGYH